MSSSCSCGPIPARRPCDRRATSGLAPAGRGHCPELLIGIGIFVYSSLALPALLIMGLPWLSVGADGSSSSSSSSPNFVTLRRPSSSHLAGVRPDASWAPRWRRRGCAARCSPPGGCLRVAPAAQGSRPCPRRSGPTSGSDGGGLGRELPMDGPGSSSLRYHAMMRRRLALRLADPVVCNRFLLWAVWGISCCVLSLLDLGYNPSRAVSTSGGSRRRCSRSAPPVSSAPRSGPRVAWRPRATVRRIASSASS